MLRLRSLRIFCADANALFPAVFLAVGCLGFSSCASTGSGTSVEDWDEVPMARAMPYPSDRDFSDKSYELIVVNQFVDGVPSSALDRAVVQAKRTLERFARTAGVGVIDRSIQDDKAIVREGVLSEMFGRSAELDGADFALITSFTQYRHSSGWKRPAKMLWQDSEDIAEKPGTCRHLGKLELDVKLYRIGANDRSYRIYTLENENRDKTKHIDDRCPYAQHKVDDLLEEALEEALECMETPIQNLLAPHGYVVERRVGPKGKPYLYRTTLGARDGASQGSAVEIFRVEQSASSHRDRVDKTERPIGRGHFTDNVSPSGSWIELDEGRLKEEVQDGDVVRPVFKAGFFSSMGCDEILSES